MRLSEAVQEFRHSSDRLNGSLLLKVELFRALRDSPQVVLQGLMVVLLVGLLVGGVDGVRGVLATLSPDQELERFQSQMEQSLSQQAMAAQTPDQRLVVRVLQENLAPGIDIIRRTQALSAPLPRPVRAVLYGLGVLVSRPLAYLQGVLLAVAFTQLAARWFGGRGSIQQMLGVGALSVAPHVLDALTFIPYLGSTIALVSWGWGLLILVVGTGVVHRLETGYALLAVLFFPMIGVLLAGLGCCGFLGWVMTLLVQVAP
ncbi:MAG: YIP1 family protein [Chloroflexaceae bacterium]|nr:YIP1 family protein [Chloroflexaceae bacterium]